MGNADLNIIIYTVITGVILLVIFGTQLYHYMKNYVAAYEESANRMIRLAEKIRKLPLSFFDKKDATEDEVIAAARLANCDDFIKGMPGEYDTEIGEMGGHYGGNVKVSLLPGHCLKMLHLFYWMKLRLHWMLKMKPRYRKQ